MSATRRVRVLIVDDDERRMSRMRATLSSRFVCEVASSGREGLSTFESDPFDVVVSGNQLRGMTGLDLLDSVHERRPETKFILVGEDAAIVDVIEAGKRGAYDYVVRASDELALIGSVDRAAAAVDARRVGRQAERPPPASAGALIGTSPRLVQTFDAVERVVQSNAPVLLVGEIGTGKGLLARRIHARGPRRHRPYVVVRPIPSTHLEGELFGRHADTVAGAPPARGGLIEEADGGTLFIEEVADLPMDVQGRLLYVLESGVVRSLGVERERRVDVRLVAATRRDLSRAVRERAFRADLYFCLSALAIRVPPLRERRDDLPALIAYFFETARAKNPRSPVEEISAPAMDRLVRRGWPGNARELKSVIERLVAFATSARVEAQDLDDLLRTDWGAVEAAPVGKKELTTLRDMTARYVDSVLASTNGDKARAAEILGVDVSTLYRWQRRRPSRREP